LGSDFDGFGGTPPAGLEDVSCVPNITAALLERGYSAEDTAKVLGGNWLRVLRQVTGA
jgi:membrane dipeptidase